MEIGEIKGIIKDLVKNATKDNVSPIASTLSELNQFIHDQFSNSIFVIHYEDFSGKLKEKINLLEQKNEKLALEIAAIKTNLKQEEEIERKHNQLLIEREKLKALEEKQKAIEELTHIQSKVLDLTNLNKTAMQENIEGLKKLNGVLANAYSDLEKDLAANVLTTENNLSAIQKTQLNALEKFDKSQLEKFGEEFMKQVTALIKDYNEYAEKINLYRINQEGVIALFKENHTENVNIHEALKNRNEALGNLENLNREIKERLEKYDNEIKSLIVKRDQLPIYQLAETRKYQ